MIQSSLPYAQITVCVHVAITQTYQDYNVSYSKNQSTILTILLLQNPYQTDSQLLHLQNTNAKNVIKAYYKKSCQ